MGKGKGWTTGTAISSLVYPYFEAMVWKKFGEEIESRKFDVVHRITPLTPTAPSSLAWRCRDVGVPFVVGPVNGGVPWPKHFDAERRREREWLSYVRGIYRLRPSVKRTFDASSAILVGSRHTQSEIPAKAMDRTIYMPENGVDPDRFSRLASPGARKGPLRVCFVGRLVPYKGPDMLLEAVAPLLRGGGLTLDIIGDGPMLGQLTDMAKSLPGVTFHGWLQHRDVQNVMSNCDLLGFPSIREFGGGVVLEAMALGLPPLVVDYAGPGELVQPGRGYKVPMGPRGDIIAGIRDELKRLIQDRASLSEVGLAGRAWVEQFMTWQRKAEQIAHVYRWAIDHTGDRPVLL